jgi:hypothetical protein
MLFKKVKTLLLCEFLSKIIWRYANFIVSLQCL